MFRTLLQNEEIIDSIFITFYYTLMNTKNFYKFSLFDMTIIHDVLNNQKNINFNIVYKINIKYQIHVDKRRKLNLKL